MNVSWTRPVVLAAVALSVVVLGRFYAKPVLAQVRAALVQNVDEPARNPYQQSVLFNQDATACPNNFYCYVLFKPVPAGYRLEITYAAAQFSLANGGTEASAELSTNGSLSGNNFPLPPPAYIGLNYYSTASPVTFYVEAGQRPSIIVSGNPVRVSSNSSEVAISGHLVAVP